MATGPHPSAGQEERRRTDRALRVLIVDDDHDTVATLSAIGTSHAAPARTPSASNAE